MKIGNVRSPSLVAVCVAMLLIPAVARAQESVSEITVIAGGSSSIPPPPGYTKIGVDLNAGAGGAFIYVCYKKGVGAPITGLYVTRENQQPPVEPVFTKIPVDLNQGAGGDFIWLWYTKDPSCTTICNLAVILDSQPVPAGHTRIPVDLNATVGGSYIYLCYEEQ